MPYTTIVSGTTIASSWANANVRDQVVTPFASASARNSAISSPVEGMIAVTNDVNVLTVYNGSAWVCITPVTAVVATSQNTASTTYVDLGTVGPAVTLETGTQALVTVGATMTNGTINDGAAMSFAVSGATTLAAADANAVYLQNVASGQNFGYSFVSLVTGLTAGSNTFTAKYRAVTGGTATFVNRNIVVVGIP